MSRGGLAARLEQPLYAHPVEIKQPPDPHGKKCDRGPESVGKFILRQEKSRLRQEPDDHHDEDAVCPEVQLSGSSGVTLQPEAGQWLGLVLKGGDPIQQTHHF